MSPNPIGAVDVTKPYKFIRFGAMDVTKPYEFIGFGAMDVTKPYEFIGFGAVQRRSDAKSAEALLASERVDPGAQVGLVRD